jgi:threonine dehydratase
MTSSQISEPSIRVEDIAAAADRLRGLAVRTPLLESPTLNKQLGGRLLVKAEGLQRTGSFKFRGAFNRLNLLDEAERALGVVAYSSGNHAQGVAAAAQLLGIPARIVMPADAPRLKIENTRSYGAEVILYDRVQEDRQVIAQRLVDETGASLIPPYDDAAIVAGQGTVGLEIVEDLEHMGMRADAILVPCSGGGLTAGIATATAALSPRTAIYTVEPTGFDDTARSLANGDRVRNTRAETGLCDALLVATPGALTFAINRRLVAGGLAVDDEDVVNAMAVAFANLKIVVEPSGAVALAATLSRVFETTDRTVVAVASGANVDHHAFCQAIDAGSR